ncbi:MAG: hypothetical protein KKA81_12465 [Bacteroidetes bacterium]|nr:hypothetical protein [Bacteroidota bacterium]
MKKQELIKFSAHDKLAEITGNIIPGFDHKLKTIIPESLTSITSICVDPTSEHLFVTSGRQIFQFYANPVKNQVIRKVLCYGEDENYSKIAITPDGKTLLVKEESNKKLLSIEVATGKRLDSYDPGDRNIDEICTSNNFVVLNLGNRFYTLLDRFGLEKINDFKPIGDEDKYCCHDTVLDNEFDTNKILYYADSIKWAVIAVNMADAKIVGRYESWSPYGYCDIYVDDKFVYARDAYYGKPHNKVYKWDKRSSRPVSRYYPKDGAFINSYIVGNSYLAAITKNKIGIWDFKNHGTPEKINSKYDLSAYGCIIGNKIIVASGKNILYWNIKGSTPNKRKSKHAHDRDIIHLKPVGKNNFFTHNYHEIAVWKVTDDKIKKLYSYEFDHVVGLRSVNYSDAKNLLITTNTSNGIVRTCQLDSSFTFSQTNEHKYSVRNTLIADDKLLYTVSHDNSVHKYALDDLKLLQVYQDEEINAGYSSSLIIDEQNDHLLFGNHGSPESGKETLYVFIHSTGMLKKKFVFDTKTDYSTPVEIWKDKYVVGGGSKSLHFIDRSTLNITKKFTDVSEFGMWAFVMDGSSDTGFFTDDKGSVYSINLESGKVIKKNIFNNTLVRLLLVDNYVFASGYQGKLFKLNKKLKVIKEYQFENELLWDLYYNKKKDVLLIALANGTLKAIDLTGKKLYSMLNTKRGFIWKQENTSDNPWFFTDQTNLITVAKVDKEGKIHEILDNNDPKRLEHINFYNDKRMMNNIINNSTDFLKAEQFLRLEEGVKNLKSIINAQKLLAK